jgi:hypothetical protein
MSRCRHRRSHRVAATALLPLSRCAPPPQHRNQAAANVAQSRCRHRFAAAKLLPTSAFALPPPLQLPSGCCRAAAALPPTLRCRAAAAAALPFIGWLLRYCPPSNFVIACRHATINALVAGRFCR